MKIFRTSSNNFFFAIYLNKRIRFRFSVPLKVDYTNHNFYLAVINILFIEIVYTYRLNK